MITKTWTTTAHTVPPNCPRCIQMSEQVATKDGLFTTPEGSRILGPPLHPHCDCIVEYSNE